MLAFGLSLAFASLILHTDAEMPKRIKSAGDHIKETVRCTLSRLESFKRNITLGRKIYRNSSWESIGEFLVFKIRAKVAFHLESGLLTKPRSSFYDLIYYDGTNRYIVRFPKVRGPGKVSSVVDENQVDVTTQLTEYLGPSHNFHGIPTTPGFFGYESLTFNLRDGSFRTFAKTDQIIL